MQAEPSQTTQLLQKWSAGDAQALDRAMPLLYDHLRELAHQRRQSQAGERSLNTTDLVHEAAKRGGGAVVLEFHEDIWISSVDLEAVTELDDALKKLEAMDARQSRIVEQRYFGGLSLTEVAGVLDLSLTTVKRELRSARAWLAAELNGEVAI